MRATKKPLQVFAVRFTDDYAVREYLELLHINTEEKVTYAEETDTIHIEKRRGVIEVKRGSWIVYELYTDKSFWCVQHDIFLDTYTEVDVATNVYAKKVYDVECEVFEDLTDSSIIKVLEFMGFARPLGVAAILTAEDTLLNIQRQGYILIDTLEGVERLYPTEVLIKGVHGEYYPVARENFDKVYTLLG